MCSSEALYIRWNEFENGIKQGFSQLQRGEEFTDVTLAVENGQIRAHKVILATYSPFFKSLLKSLPHEHPLLYLRGIQLCQLEYVIAFMYQGEVRVRPEDLDEFLAIAQELQVSGLMQIPSRTSSMVKGPSNHSALSSVIKDESPKKGIPFPHASEFHHDTVELNDLLNVPCHEGPKAHNLYPGTLKRDDVLIMKKPYPQQVFGAEELDGNDKNVDKMDEKKAHKLLDDQLSKFVSPLDADKNYRCLKCSLTSKKRRILLHHVEAKHFSTNGFSCEKCGGLYKTRHSLSKHKSRIHRKDMEDSIHSP